MERAIKGIETLKGTDFADWKFRTKMPLGSNDPLSEMFFDEVAKYDDDIDNLDLVFKDGEHATAC